VSEVKVNKISPRSGTDVTLGDSGDTFTVPTGVTLDTSNSTVTLPDGTVTNAKVNASAAIDYSKLNLTGNIALADLSATGTKDATTFLRGDNTFAAAGGGKVLQVVQGTLTSNFSTTSTSFVATGLSVSITPSATDSKIYISSAGYVDAISNSTPVEATIYRGATNIGATNGIVAQYGAGIRLRSNLSMCILDEPNTTSATTYEVYIKGNSLTIDFNSESSKTTIIAMEIGA